MIKDELPKAVKYQQDNTISGSRTCMDTTVLSVLKVEGESNIECLGKEVVDIIINGCDIRTK
ncbi:hypothetical protein [Methanofollis sp. W23]|uniref:hypothetical protein n=1 Tax=Methanofollis sp. W23 TaxID=2817849 RepID=UPI001AE1DD34|nr:hypothetical protein [Methanofollis sp. W23]